MDQYSDIKVGCEAVRRAAREAAGQTANARNAAIRSIADRILSEGDAILDANSRDTDLAEGQLPTHMLRRLRLDETKLGLLCHRLLSLASEPDPLEDKTANTCLPELEVAVRRAPLGAVAFVYECRPELTALAVAACVKTGNAALLCSGFATSETDAAILKAVRSALRDSAYPPEAVGYIDPLHSSVPDALCKMRGAVDLLVLKDGQLSDDVGECVPVVRSTGGVSHVYIDKACDIPLAVRTTVRTLYCDDERGENEDTSVVLVHHDAAAEFFEALQIAVHPYSPEMRGCPVTREYLADAIPASRGDWTALQDSGANVLTVRVVESMEQATAHVNLYGTAGIDAIMTCNKARAALFESMTDSRTVCVNVPPLRSVVSDGVSAALGIEGLTALTRKKYLVSSVAERSAI